MTADLDIKAHSAAAVETETTHTAELEITSSTGDIQMISDLTGSLE